MSMLDPAMTKLLEQLLSSPDIPAQLKDTVTAAMSDPAKLDDALAQLQALGADQVGSGPPLSIADYYVDGDGLYELRWPLGEALPLPFDQLDRKTQFFVLFQEWSRRELEGMMLLNSGDVPGAERIFEECLERATQIEVRELEARSYEGLMRVAERRGERGEAESWLRKATAARRN